MSPESSPTCELCGRELMIDAAGHYRFHRTAAIAFLELLLDDRRGPDAENARARIAVCDRRLSELDHPEEGRRRSPGPEIH